MGGGRPAIAALDDHRYYKDRGIGTTCPAGRALAAPGAPHGPAVHQPAIPGPVAVDVSHMDHKIII